MLGVRIRTNLQNITTIMLLIVLIIGMFQIGYETAIMRQQMMQQQQDWFTRFLQKEYGVSSVEELEIKYMQEVYKNVTAMLEQEKLELQSYMYMSPTRAEYFEQLEQLNETEQQLQQQMLSQGTAPEAETEEQQVGSVYIVLDDILGCNVVMVTFPILGLTILAVITSKEPKSKRGKQTAKMLCYVLIVFAVAIISYKVGYVYGQSSTIQIEPGSFTETANYIIYGEDTDNDGIMDIIYAKNGKTGEIDFRGTDAATVIQQAIDEIYSLNGGIVFIRAGTYSLTESLEIGGGAKACIAIRSNVALIGEGIGKTILRYTGSYTGGTSTIIGTYNETVENVYIADMTLDGDRDNKPSGVATDALGAGYGDRRYWVIERVEVKNSTRLGFNIAVAQGYTGEYMYIINCVADRNHRINIRIGNVKHFAVIGCLSKNATGYYANDYRIDEGDGINIGDGAQYGIVAYNIFLDNEYHGIACHADNVIIANNFIAGWGKKGIRMTTPKRVIVIGNRLDGKGINAKGISVEQTSDINTTNDVLIIGNIVTNLNKEASESHAIAVWRRVDDVPQTPLYPQKVFIVDNVVDKAYYGIAVAENLDENAEDIVIRGNIVKNIHIYGIFVRGTNIIIEFNEVYEMAGTGTRGIALASASVNCTVRNNYVMADAEYSIALAGNGHLVEDNYVKKPIGIFAGSHTIRHNVGYVTENSGIVTGLSNGAYIAHGLADVPSVVVLTCLNATYDGVPVIVSWNQALTNSTHIAVNIYWTNGTAITDPVIAVSWYAEV